MADKRGDDVGAGPDSGKVCTGPETSDSLKYAQEMTRPRGLVRV